MRHVRAGLNSDFTARPTGERVAILVGRHRKHGGAKSHSVAAVEIGPGCSSESHVHVAREESFYIISGEGVAAIGDEKVAVIAGDLLFAESGVRHQFTNTGTEAFRYLAITAPCWDPSDSQL